MSITWSVCTNVNNIFPFRLLKCYSISKSSDASGSSCGYLVLCLKDWRGTVSFIMTSAPRPPPPLHTHSLLCKNCSLGVYTTQESVYLHVCLCLYVRIYVCMCSCMYVCMRHSAIFNQEITKIIYINFATNFFIIKPTRCTSFPNLLRHETLHVSGNSSAHLQEFIHCIPATSICHIFEHDHPARQLSTNLYDIY
jgi:hypothetical protein